MIFKKVLLCVLSSMIIFSAVGCNQNNDLGKSDNNKNDNKSNVIEKTPKKQDVQITLGVNKLSDEKVLDEILYKFQEKYPNIKINKQIIKKNYDSVIEKKVANEELDVFLVDASKLPLYVSKNYIEPIDTYIDKNILNDFYPNVLKAFQKDGKTFGLPEYYNLMVLFYNKRILQNRGIEQLPKNWKEFEIICEKVKKNNMSASVFDNNPVYFGTFMLQAGGKIVEDNNIIFNFTGGIKGLSYYYTLIKKGYADTPKDLDEKSSIDAFLKDKSSMYIGKSNLINKVQDNNASDKYGIAHLPQGTKNGNFIFTQSYAISKSSQHKNEAAELIKFIISEDAQNIINDSGIGVPSRISMEHKYIEKYPKRQALIDMLYTSQVYQFGVKHDYIVNALMRAANRVQTDRITPKNALDMARREVENKK